MSRVKRAIFIAAGEGSRLRPVTLRTPKPLVKVNGKRTMDRSIEALRQNGIEEIYIVVGYLKEQFQERYGADSHIHIIENKRYLEGNNITSMYLVRDVLPESFVLEADTLILDPSVFNPEIEKSGYLASWRKKATEWILDVENNHIRSCQMKGEREDAYQLWGVSMWTKEDGEKLAEKIREYYESGCLNIYWDEIALLRNPNEFDLGIRPVDEKALVEIDTFDELVAVDPSYRDYK